MQTETTKWEPNDVIRLAALVGGFLLCTLGATLMWLGIGAEGAVDIKSSVLSGSIKTGSAGLFLIFFGSMIVLFVVATLAAKSTSHTLTASSRESRAKGAGYAFMALLLATFVSGALGALGYGAGFGALAFGLGMLLPMVGLAYLELSEGG